MSFHLPHFLPYLLNQAAEAAGAEFERHYRSRYAMLRTEWRVLFHLGLYGRMTAKDICARASLHKTKVSRAVRALEDKRFLKREVDETDRRIEHLTLSRVGESVFKDLQDAAAAYETKLISNLRPQDVETLRSSLLALANTSKR